MRTQCLVFLYFSITYCAYAQFYNNIIDISDENSYTKIYKVGNNYLLPTFTFPHDSTYLRIDFDIYDHINYKISYKSIWPSARQSLLPLSNQIIVAGKNSKLTNDKPTIISIDPNSKDENWINTYSTPFEVIVPSNNLSLNDNIYTIYNQWNTYDSIQILSVTDRGVERWNKTFDFGSTYFIAWDMATIGDVIYVSMQYNPRGQQLSTVGMMALDEDGNLLWDKPTTDILQRGNDPINMDVLPDGNIIMEANVLDDGFDRFHKLYWVDPQGSIYREKVISIPRSVYIYGVDVKATTDGFFLYGNTINLRTDETYYGFITKFNHHGDTLWHHTYHHPEYVSNKRNQARIIDLIIEEDGSIIAFGDIYDNNGYFHAWLMHLNSDGCLSADCDSTLVLTNQEALPTHEYNIFPNPASDRVHITMEVPIQSIKVYTIGGGSVEVPVSHRNSYQAEIDVSDLSGGLYLISVTAPDGRIAQELIQVE